jgi:hypothetical protein
MAAPAQLPEFKGNVAAMLTEKYWDRELTRVKAKDDDITAKAKKLANEGKLNPSEEKGLMDKMLTEGPTERELLVIEKGISNFEFHYLGSAKILRGVGKGLAQALADLKPLRK